MGLLDGRVAVITGGGRGLGASHAKALAAEGARVFVNDVSGGDDTHDISTNEGAEALIAAAIAKFGRIDILVNNAGILRDKTLIKMSDEEWEAVIAVHLRGTWACSRAAARFWKEKGGPGRIINTTSVAGLKGNFGQANYSAAKAGIYGLTLTCALELGKEGVTVNAIAPLAKTAMTAALESVPDEYKPELVSPMVVFLASDLAKDITGRVFGIHGRHVFEYFMEMTTGVEGDWTPSGIAAQLGVITKRTKEEAKTTKAEGSNVGELFQSLPSGFRPQKAGDWEAALHFVVEGAGEWAVEVKGGGVKVASGAPAAPTCKITVDAETLMGMATGKVDPNMAFMKGRIKATRVGDLAKFGKAFDFSRVKAPPAPAAAAKPVDATSLFGVLPGRFIPEKAAGFNGVIAFTVDGAEAALEVRDGACTLHRGAHPKPTGKVTTDPTTFAGVLDGRIDAQEALKAGRIKVTHPAAWLKFRQMFRFEPDKGLNRALIGRTFRAPAVMVDARRVEFYDEVAGDRGSPVFPVTLIKPLFMALFDDPQFNGDVARMVHGEQEFVYHRPIRAGDLIVPRGTVTAIEDKSTGQLMHFKQTMYSEGEPAVEMTSRLFFRGEGEGGKKEAPAARPVPEESFDVMVPMDQPKRYAEASGDNNPIHVDEAFAKSVGFKGVILQGLGTLALVAANLPKPLTRLAARFAKPVYPGDRLTTRVWKRGAALEFETVNPAGEVVLANGLAER